MLHTNEYDSTFLNSSTANLRSTMPATLPAGIGNASTVFALATPVLTSKVCSVLSLKNAIVNEHFEGLFPARIFQHKSTFFSAESQRRREDRRGKMRCACLFVCYYTGMSCMSLTNDRRRSRDDKRYRAIGGTRSETRAIGSSCNLVGKGGAVIVKKNE